MEVGELGDESGASPSRFAHADDAAAADVDAGGADAIQRIQPVAIIARSDDLAVELGRGVEVVVVIVQAGFAQPLGLPIL